MRVEDERKRLVYKRHNKKGRAMMLVHESKYLGASYRRAYISVASFALSARAPSLSVYVFAILNRPALPYRRYSWSLDPPHTLLPSGNAFNLSAFGSPSGIKGSLSRHRQPPLPRFSATRFVIEHFLRISRPNWNKLHPSFRNNDSNSNSSMDIVIYGGSTVVKVVLRSTFQPIATYPLGKRVLETRAHARSDERKASVLGNYVRHVWLLDYIYIPTLVIGRRVSPEGRCANTCL